MPTPTPGSTQASGTPPALVALLRSLIIVAAVGALTALVAALTGLDLSSIPAEWRPVAAAIVIIIIRTLEGAIDQLRGQAPQAGPLGSAPASPAIYAAQLATAQPAPLPDDLAVRILGTERTTAELEAILAATAGRLEARRQRDAT